MKHVGLNVAADPLMTLAYVGTDLDEEDVFDTDWAEDTVVFTVSKSM